MAVYGYIFCCHAEKNAEELRLVALRHYAAALGLSLDELVVERGENPTGPFSGREGGRRLLRQCRRGDSIVTLEAAWLFGELAESRLLLEQLSREGVSLLVADLGGDISLPEKRRLVVSEGPAALVQKLLAILVDSGGVARGTAIRAGKQLRRQAGKYLGGPVPFGRRVDDEGYLVDNPEEQELIRVIIALRQERCSYRRIAGRLQEEYGFRISHEGVRRVVQASAEPEVDEEQPGPPVGRHSREAADRGRRA